GGEQEDRRCFHQHREPEQVDIEIATATQVRRAQSDVVHASCVKSYRHLKPPGTTPIMEPSSSEDNAPSSQSEGFSSGYPRASRSNGAGGHGPHEGWWLCLAGDAIRSWAPAFGRG